MGGADDKRFVVLGRITGLFGVRGWVKLFSETEPRDGVLTYSPWYLRRDGEWVAHRLAEGKRHGKGVVVRLEGYDDRDRARDLIGREIAVLREQLPAAGAEEYYWADLIGLEVSTSDGVELGRVDHLLETGANDVLVVEGERQRLIPFVAPVVVEVDRDNGRLVVDWDPEF